MSKKIIVFSGKQLSGKDCVAKMLLAYLSDFKRIGLGDAIKIEYATQTGLTLEEIEINKAHYRSDLIALGNKRRAEDEDYWIKKIVEFPFNCVVPDVRMLRELNFFKSQNAFTVRVNAPLEMRLSRGALANVNDDTETQLDDVTDWDYIIENDGSLEELKEKVTQLFEYLKENFLVDDDYSGELF